MKKKKVFNVLAVVFSILLLGGSSAAKKVGSISGIIIEKCSKKPIPNIKMHLSLYISSGPNIKKETSTDEKGMYRFKNLGPGTYRLEIMPHHPYCYRIEAKINNNEVIKMKKSEDIICNGMLEIGGSVMGYVYKEPGVPFSNVLIHIRSFSGSTGFAKSKEDGSFSIENLCASERYDIEFAHKISGHSFKFLAGIYVEEGKNTKIEDVVFNFEDVTGVEGHVTSSIDGKPLANARLSFNYVNKIDKLGFSSGEVYTDTNGYFYMKNLTPGKYFISTLWPMEIPKRNPKTGKLLYSFGYLVMKNKKHFYVDVEKDKISKIDIGIDIPSTIITEGVKQK